MEYRYQIGDKTFIQRPLVLGQVRQMITLIDGLALPQEFNPAAMINLLGENLFQALAVVLTEDGQPLAGKDLEALGRDLEFSITPDTALEVVADFFGCNPIASLLTRLSGTRTVIDAALGKIGLTTSSAPSPKGTSPVGTPSSGGTPRKSANPT
jgi:hypothetical protein